MGFFVRHDLADSVFSPLQVRKAAPNTMVVGITILVIFIRGAVEYAAPETIHRPNQKNVEPTTHGVLEHLVKRRALVSPFAAADPLILILVDDLEATTLCQPGKYDSLVLGGLAVTADPKVDRRP